MTQVVIRKTVEIYIPVLCRKCEATALIPKAKYCGWIKNMLGFYFCPKCVDRISK